jgi:hypothetical protein
MGDEPFHGREQPTVDHDGTVTSPVRTDVGEVEPFGLLEVQLRGREGLLVIACVEHLQVDLRTVEGGLSGRISIGQAELVEHAGQSSFSLLPLLVGAEVTVAATAP